MKESNQSDALAKQAVNDQFLLSLIKSLVAKRATYGYRRIHALINKALILQGKNKVNHKRIYRIMKAHHLLLTRANRKPVRTHEGKIITLKSNLRWCSDGFVFVAGMVIPFMWPFP